MGINVTVRSERKENQLELFQSHQYLEKISQLSKRMMLEQMGGVDKSLQWKPKQNKSSVLENQGRATVQSSR